MKNDCRIIFYFIICLIFYVLNDLSAQTLSNNALPEESQKPSEKVAQINSDTLNKHIQLGKAYFNRKDYYNAKSEFLFILSKAPKNIEAFNYLGRIYLAQKKYREAAIVFQQALKEEPNNRLARDGIRQVNDYQKLKQLSQKLQAAINKRQWNEAARNLDQIEDIEPSFEGLKGLKRQLAQHFYELGKEAEKLGNPSTALRYYQQVRRLVPDYFNIAQKIASLQRVAEIQNELENFYIQGIEAFQQEDWDAAISALEQVVNQNKEYKDATDILALARDKKYALLHSADTISIRKHTFAESTQTIIPPLQSSKTSIDSVSERSELAPLQLMKTKLNDWVKSWWFILSGIAIVMFIFSITIHRFTHRDKDDTAKVHHFARKHLKRKMDTTAPAPEMEPTSDSDAEVAKAPGEDTTASETEKKKPPISIDVPKSPIETTKFSSRYEIKTLLGRIGNIKFYKAYDRRLDREVIIDKISLIGSQRRQSSLQKDIIKGIQDAAKLNHPNIIRVEDILKQTDTIYITLERIEGIDLSQLLKQEKRLDVRRSVNIIRQICYALDYAHRKGMIHYDVRPFNIKIMTNDFVKLSGFELASLMQINDLTTSAISKNDPSYISPEQIKNGEIDLRTDIFSLGVVAYEMITGRLPFKGEYISSTIYQILEVTPEPPSTLNHDLPEEINSIIMKMLEKEVNKRYFNALDIALQLKKFI